MSILSPIALIVLMLGTSSAPPAAGFHWKRTIAPPAGHAGDEACIVLDADSFSHAEPGLSDLRLYQDGQELPYAVEESFDKRALEHDVVPADDRSLYEVADREPMSERQPGGAPNDGRRRSYRTHRLLGPDEPDPSIGYFTDFRLPPRVPIERVHIEPEPDTPELLGISASPVGQPTRSERVEGIITPSQPAMPVTLGANLQTEAKVSVGVDNTDHVVRSVILEMRRRSLCYHPRSVSPLLLYLGNGGLAAPRYDFAEHFATDISRPISTLGPLLPNPDFHPAPQRHAMLTRVQGLRLATLLSAAFFLFSANRMLRTKKSPAP